MAAPTAGVPGVVDVAPDEVGADDALEDGGVAGLLLPPHAASTRAPVTRTEADM